MEGERFFLELDRVNVVLIEKEECICWFEKELYDVRGVIY